MTVENVTGNRGYQLPHLTNKQKDDVLRLIAALNAIDADMADVVALLAVRARIDSPAFTGGPTAPTQSPGDNSLLLATTAFVAAALATFSPPNISADSIDSGTLPDERLSFSVSSFIRTLLDDNSVGAARTTLDVFSKAEVTAAIAALVASAPSLLNTLDELAAALGDDPNFATTILTALAGKASTATQNDAAWQAGSSTTESVVSPDKVKKAVGALASGAANAILEDQKSSGTDGGTFTNGAWRTRTLNTKVKDTLSLIALSSNQFTPSVAGEVEWEAPAFNCNMHKSRLYNVTDGSVAAVGTSENSGNSSFVSNKSTGRGAVLAGKTYRIEHQCLGTRSTDGLGLAAGFSEIEVYTRVKFWKS